MSWLPSSTDSNHHPSIGHRRRHKIVDEHVCAGTADD